MSQHAPSDDTSAASDPPLVATVQAGRLADAVDALAALVSECVVDVGSDGLAVAAQDPATVALVDLDLPSTVFEAYDATETRLGVDLERLGDVVSVADPDAPVRLAFDPERRRLDVRAGDLAYTLGLVDPDAVRSPPDTTGFEDCYAATVGLGGDEFAHLVTAASMVSDHVELGAEADTFYAAAEGDVDEVRVDHAAADRDPFAVDDPPLDSLFSTSYLEAIARVVPDDADVRLRLGDGQPLELAFDHAGGSVRYVVAPRIKRT